ncbi:MAG: hypothetical protein M0006_00060 [Magnetospirillum sp.]|nr:hypothetical protein [Magnetospirillum sp.]
MTFDFSGHDTTQSWTHVLDTQDHGSVAHGVADMHNWTDIASATPTSHGSAPASHDQADHSAPASHGYADHSQHHATEFTHIDKMHH